MENILQEKGQLVYIVKVVCLSLISMLVLFEFSYRFFWHARVLKTDDKLVQTCSSD